MSEIVLFATYWNEIDWISISLNQIDEINPNKIFICEGNFDPKFQIGSSDGTKDILALYAKKNKNVKIISPIRKSKYYHIIKWFFFYAKGLPLKQRLKRTYGILKTNIYRLNQTETFNAMLKMSKLKENDWFMTVDADQFYSNTIIEDIKKINSSFNFDMISCKELTFFGDEKIAYEKFESRDYNNMPHRYKNGLIFIPTRNPAIIYNNKFRVISEISKLKKFGGLVYHYKFKSKSRLIEGYNLGDRKITIGDGHISENLEWDHPNIIKKNMDHIQSISKNSINLLHFKK